MSKLVVASEIAFFSKKHSNHSTKFSFNTHLISRPNLLLVLFHLLRGIDYLQLCNFSAVCKSRGVDFSHILRAISPL